jgi:hypothetical protein
VFLLMVDYLYGPVQHDAFFKKYASKKFLKGKLNNQQFFGCTANIFAASMVVRAWVKQHGVTHLNDLPRSHPLNPKNRSR